MVSIKPTEVLIEATELLALLKAQTRHIVLLDVRLGDEGRNAYLEAHAQNAVFADLATEFAGKAGGIAGKRPLPRPEDLTRDAQRWGIRDDSLIVLYDDNGNRQAARGWWTLIWAGSQDVRLLNGGLGAWREAGGKVTTDVPLPPRGDIVLTGGHLGTLDADSAAALARDGILVDARGKDAYSGADGGGHIPGAASLPTGGNIDAETGKFLSKTDLRARFLAEGLPENQTIGVYCGGGVAAAHEIAALTIAGYETLLFPGSWSAWSADPARPIATGPKPA
ncbi:rhodanese-like domain-containing protein [Brucella intermedia]|uniref:sulfurtransferase n=1 Tax=Brucella intermedia TaxID=94625 RepID=UPI00209A94A3|nr:rhodanese-like domain-containing protein [Brucella intermedia]MCO7728704.1 rhodanese-like domain-containing protein [Brucella intermedia]